MREAFKYTLAKKIRPFGYLELPKTELLLQFTYYIYLLEELNYISLYILRTNVSMRVYGKQQSTELSNDFDYQIEYFSSSPRT